ncbi:MAG: Rne/Rng family ribonuclease [Nitriliruptorales bacterium]|nr:Rne/Rng family ribonuclease [Nitriliruptorales bacterium]
MGTDDHDRRSRDNVDTPQGPTQPGSTPRAIRTRTRGRGRAAEGGRASERSSATTTAPQNSAAQDGSGPEGTGNGIDQRAGGAKDAGAEDEQDETPEQRRRTRVRVSDGRSRTTPAEGAKVRRKVTADTAGDADEPEVEVEAEPGSASASGAVVRRRRRRRTEQDEAERSREATTTAAADPGGEASESSEEEAGDAERSDVGVATRERGSSRRRRRGGRGRGRRGRGRGNAAQGERAGGGDEEAAPSDATPAAATQEAANAPTRLSARSRGRGRSGARSDRGRSGLGSARGARRPLGAVSEETRRAIADSPPKRMLVTVGQQRTQIVVMEERNLVEHYVTRREDISYVGNIYLGRIQNVLPGMEAAFVDIGKGRNGVLYAGEVNYDEVDLDGELPRIEQTLKPGQSVLVQVTKDPMGTKGARLTQQLSIAGRYCVLAPGDGMLGISRKLPDEERERLRKILKSIKPEAYGLIVRTAAEGATREQLEDDVVRLVRIWEQVQAKAETAQPLEPVYEEPDLVIRVIRDIFGTDYSDLVVDDQVLAEQIRAYLRDVSPELVDHVSVHSGDDALFDGYEVTNQIRRALEKKVWLQSGGYLIVEKTEAMWVIDVNTGKFVGRTNLEETVLRNNLEAAEEIARQLRLRDMGGIIVIDFVDMLIPANRDEVLKRFKRELARDRTKSRVMEISKLGLVQMTRKNVSQGLNESFTTNCDCCEGRGAQIVESMLG